MADRRTLQDVVDAYLAALSRNDGDAIMELFGEDPRLEDPIGATPRQGRKEVAEFYAVPRAITLVKRLGPLTVHNNHVGFQFRVGSTGQRTAGPDNDGAPLEISITEILGFDDDGKIVSMVAVPDFDSGDEPLTGRTFP